MKFESITIENSVVRRILGFFTLPLLSMVVPLAILPYVSRLGGVEAWASIGLGQSLGGFVSVVGGLGWSISGPRRVASANTQERVRLYWVGLITRLFAVSVALILGLCLLLFSAPMRLLAILSLISTAASTLAPDWYCIGTGSSKGIAIHILFPRIMGAVVALALMWLTGSVIWYPIMSLLGSLIGTLTFDPRLGKAGARFDLPRGREVLASIKGQTAVSFAGVLSATYSTLPITLVSFALAPGELARYVSGDKLYRAATMAVDALSNAFQGWVSEEEEARPDRARMAVRSHVLLAVLGLVGFAVFGPIGTRILFGSHVAINRPTSIFFGLAFFAISINSSLGRHVLAARGNFHSYLASTAAGAMVGVPSLIVGSRIGGIAGGAAGFAAGELAVLAAQVIALTGLRVRYRAKSYD